MKNTEKNANGNVIKSKKIAKKTPINKAMPARTESYPAIIIIFCPRVNKVLRAKNKKLKTNIVVARGPALRR